MPPRRSARLAELANPHFQLSFPPNVVALLFSQLPLDARLRAREVCRGWRFFLEDASFWTRVDLSASCGVNPRYLLDSRLALALLRTACVRAKGNLQSADLSGVFVGWQTVPFVMQWLDSASAPNKASLRDLMAPTFNRSRNPNNLNNPKTVYVWLQAEQVTALCRALPLCRVRCNVFCDAVEALPMLRREPPHELLTINALLIFHNLGGDQVAPDLATALTGYKGMEQLNISGVLLDTRATVDALVDAAISAGIKDMDFTGCRLTQTALPALTRLIQSPGFERLEVWNDNGSLFEGPALPAFCAALRISTSLRTLGLDFVNLWADLAAATQLFDALEGLLALRQLSLHGNPADGTPAVQRAAGECLAHLIARSSCLRVLNLRGNALGETGLAPIFVALRNNSSLTTLIFWAIIGAEQIGEQISAEFARDVVLPAVRANTRLRRLEGLRSVDADAGEDPLLREVEDILKARRLADEEAA